MLCMRNANYYLFSNALDYPLVSFLQYRKVKITKLNKVVNDWSDNKEGAKVRYFIIFEFFVAMGRMVTATGFNCRGCELWSTTN
jgi:hypothetical protein